MKKRIVCISAFSIILSSLSGWAEDFEEEVFFEEEVQQLYYAETPSLFGRYPGENEYTLTESPAKLESTMTPGSSPAENVFTVNDNGKKTSYVLLDKDSEGNYFVITETEFGQKSFTSLASADINKFETLDSAWYFDPENASSIAYWLNNQFLISGNGGLILPASVKDNILEREWVVENNVVSDNSTRPTENSAIKANEYKESRDDVRMITSKLSFISLTEYKAYSDKISASAARTVDVDKPLGFMTRTIRSTVSGRRDDLTFSNYFLHICGANDQTYVTCEVNGNFDNSYYVRPVFWLDKDFFKNEKIDLATAGENVKNEVKAHLYADLTYVYTDAELSNIGIDAENLPKAENVIVAGLKMPGSTPEIEYLYNGADTENGSVYEIYSVGENDALTLEASHTGKWTIPEALAGKKVKLAVIPVDENGKMGARAWSSVFAVGTSAGAVVSETSFKDADSNPINTLSNMSKLTAEVEVKNTDTVDMPCTVIIAQYNSENQIKAMNISNVSAVNGDNTFEVSLENVTTEAGDYVRVMVRANLKPIYSSVIK